MWGGGGGGGGGGVVERSAVDPPSHDRPARGRKGNFPAEKRAPFENSAVGGEQNSSCHHQTWTSSGFTGHNFSKGSSWRPTLFKCLEEQSTRCPSLPFPSATQVQVRNLAGYQRKVSSVFTGGHAGLCRPYKISFVPYACSYETHRFSALPV